jgi:formamidopyrimidine-DNA glycosylase
MPELPEVETVRRGLLPALTGRKIRRAELRRADLRFPFPDNFAARLRGRIVTGIGRRAKYLLFHLDDGLTVIGHLGMSGSWRIETDDGTGVPGSFHVARSREAAHDHFVMWTERPDGGLTRIVYNDPRRFGFMLLAEPGMLEDHPLIRRLGVEPTGNALSASLLQDLFENRSAPLKAAMLDQNLIAGLGNIYVSEALWRAGLSPRRKASTVAARGDAGAQRAEALANSIRAVIADAIAAGGSSLRDFMSASGELGYFQHAFAVYDREGQPCPRPRCSGIIKRIIQSGRSTYYCPKCQR